MQNNPYVGPRAFDTAESRFFFGREEETKILAGLVMSRRVVLLFAKSGVGKSSLVRAGLIPSLIAERTVGRSGRARQLPPRMRVLPVATVGGGIPSHLTHPLDNIYSFNALYALRRQADPNSLAPLTLSAGLAPFFEAGEVPTPDGQVVALAPTPPPELHSPIPTLQSSTPSTLSLAPPTPTLLILDQFEELFTRHLARWAEREGFFRQVNLALQDHPTLHVLFVMREDYIAELTPYTNLIEGRLESRYRLEQLNRAAALKAVKQPAHDANCPFADNVAEALIDNLRRIQVKQPNLGPPLLEEKQLGEYVEPVHLQIVCHQLWASLPEDRTTIAAGDVQVFGDVDEALMSFYEDTLTKVLQAEGLMSDERTLRRWFNEKLITPAHTRGLVYRGETETEGLPNAAVDLLNAAWIIRADSRGGNIWYELAHDRLVEPILRANQAWQPPEISAFSVEPNIISVGQEVTLTWQVMEADRVLIEPPGLEVQPTGSVRLAPTQTIYYTLRAERKGAEPAQTDPFRVIVTDVQAGPVPANPYPGPRSFVGVEAHLFFGRDPEAAELLLLVLDQPLVLVFGPAGSGITSLFNGRLMPYLHQQGCYVFPVGRVSGRLPREAALENSWLSNLSLSLVPEADLNPSSKWSLRELLAEVLASTAPYGRPWSAKVLIIDQFEEILQYNNQQRLTFFAQLREALTSDPQLKIVLGLRGYALAELEPYSALFPDGFKSRFYLPRLDRASALEAITRPAKLAGRPFTEGVAEAMIDTMVRGKVENADQYIEPFHLQLICHQLWAQLRPGETIQREDIAAFGDADAALSAFYESCLHTALRRVQVSERQLRTWFERQLITPVQTRSLVYRGPTETNSLPNQLVDRLVDSSLLRSDTLAGSIVHELASDLFIAPILASNRRWFAAYLNPISAPYEAWQAAGRRPDKLLSGPILREAEAFAQENPLDVTADELAFLKDSLLRESQRLQEQRRAVWWRRIISVVGLLVIVVLAALSIWALDQAERANQAAPQVATSAAQAENARQVAAIEATRVAELNAEKATQEADKLATREAVATLNQAIATNDHLKAQTDAANAGATMTRAAEQLQILTTENAILSAFLPTETPTATPTRRTVAIPSGTITPAPNATATPVPDQRATALAVQQQLAPVKATQTKIAEIAIPTATPQPSPTPPVPALIAPPSGKLVFVSNRVSNNSSLGHLFTMNADGSDPRQLTRDFAAEPDYSAAVGQVVFSKPQLGGIVALFSIRPDGSAERGIDTQFWDNWEPALPADDAQRIAFNSSRENRDWEIWLSRFPAVDEAPQLVTCEPTASAEFPELLKWAPAWSRDGKNITFVVSPGRDQYSGEANIWMMAADGTDCRQLTNTGPNVVNKYPDWSPDGRQIVFVSNRNGNFELFVMDSSGGSQRRVPASPNILTIRPGPQTGTGLRFLLQPPLEIIRPMIFLS